MKALIRGHEIIIEPFPQWIIDNLDYITGKETDTDGNPIKGDGWALVEDYKPEDDNDEGN